MSVRAGVVGVTGYSGQELLRILLRHPAVSVRYRASLRLKKRAGSIEVFDAARAADRCDVLFLALPHGTAMQVAPAVLKANSRTRVVDLSGDFRLQSAAVFRSAYGLKHSNPGWLRNAAYGLTEYNRDAIRKTRLVANPGCYPTAALLALGPLAEAGLIDPAGTVVDAKSGVTGAGRTLKEDMLFSELNENLRAYKVNAHQHIPEMEQEISRWAKRRTGITFVPHLVPLDRGLYVTIYAGLKRKISGAQLRRLYLDRYRKEPFIRLLPEGSWPEVKAVAGTNFCDIALQANGGPRRVILLGAIDNLGKGAAGQAVQNMNLLFNLPETAGLLPDSGASSHGIG